MELSLEDLGLHLQLNFTRAIKMAFLQLFLRGGYTTLPN